VKLFPQRAVPPPISVAEFLSSEYEWSLLGERLLRGVDHGAGCRTLSGGQWMRVRLARALTDDYLILDEPTNDLDRDGREAVLRFLCDRVGGSLLISHDRECLELCKTIFELSNRGLAKFADGWSAYQQEKDRERERLSAALDVAKRERDAASAQRAEQKARQEKRNRRGASIAARGGAPKIMLGTWKRRAQATSGALDAATLERANGSVRTAYQAFSEIKVEPVMYADLVANGIPAQKLIAEADSYNVRFREWLYAKDLTFAWRGNVRIALKGDNGSGKSTLLRALQGADFATRGELRHGDLATLYIDQNCGSLDDTRSVLENVRAVSHATQSEVRTDLARFLFAGDAVFQNVSELSGGERLRASLAKGFLGTTKPQLLLLDEPTNNLDLANIEFLEELVSEFRGAVIVVSHDNDFLKQCGVEQELSL
jgi:ATPase subunit of ABC transporter with duplicated ATPase domains